MRTECRVQGTGNQLVVAVQPSTGPIIAPAECPKKSGPASLLDGTP